jgi:hypothetical protein
MFDAARRLDELRTEIKALSPGQLLERRVRLSDRLHLQLLENVALAEELESRGLDDELRRSGLISAESARQSLGAAFPSASGPAGE